MILSLPASKRFPQIIETKENLAGVKKTFACHRLVQLPGHVVVLHVAEQAIPVASFVVPAGTLTFGHFWAQHPYNVYHWLTPTGATLGMYFNIAADTLIGEDTLYWRDLVLDVLVLPQRNPEILDRHELPPEISEALQTQIEAALESLLQAMPRLQPQLEAQADALWQQVFDAPRAAGVAP